MGQDEELRLGRRGAGKKRGIQARLPDETEARADCRGNEVLQSIIYEWDWFNWRDSRNEDRMRSTRADFTRVPFRVVEEKRCPIETPPAARLILLMDLLRLDLCEYPGDRWFVLGSFNRDARLRDSRRRARERAFDESSIKVGRPLSNRPR